MKGSENVTNTLKHITQGNERLEEILVAVVEYVMESLLTVLSTSINQGALSERLGIRL